MRKFKKPKYIFLKIFFLFLCFNTLVRREKLLISAETINEQQGTEINMIGSVGPTYYITAHNIIFPMENVKLLNILKESEASVLSAFLTNGEPEKIVPFIISSNIQEKPGAYEVVLGIKKDPNVHKSITVFITDKCVATDGHSLLMGHDFELKKSEKVKLTINKIKKLSEIRAYDIVSGSDITKDVTGNPADLVSYLQRDEEKVSHTFSVRGVQLEIQSYTLLSFTQELSEKLTYGNSREKLPNAGEIRKGLLSKGLVLLTLLFICIFLIFAFRKKYKKERR